MKTESDSKRRTI